MSLYQGNAKDVASSNIKSYGIFTKKSVNGQLVNELLFKNRYIYVPKVCVILVIIPSVAQCE